MRLRVLTAAVAVLAVAAGCTGNSPAPRNTAAATPAATTAPPAAAVDNSCQPRRSLRPTGALPRPGAMPAGSYMAQIQKQGRLRVGTSQDTLLFSSRNPITGKIEGFDVDIARKIAQAIFGDPSKIQIIVTTNDKRIPYVTGGTVDIVAKTMTMNCARWKQVDFSSVYYEAGQRVLVSTDSAATGIADLAGKKVCAASGSTSLDNLARLNPPPVTVGLPTQADCLVAFQRNQVDAVSTDDTILAGMAAQDPYATVVGERFTEEPYGLAISKDHPEFTRFVNAVLAGERTDGGWQQTYSTWLGRFGAAPKPPAAQYKD
jgi:polar amino acid transport system substrate-binding protein